MITEITDEDRRALADTYGRTQHGAEAFEQVKARAAAGTQADLDEICAWRTLVDQLFGETSVPVEGPAPDVRTEMITLILRGLYGTSSTQELPTGSAFEATRCADLLVAAGYSRETNSLVQQLAEAQAVIMAMTLAASEAEIGAADRIRTFLELNYPCACADDDPDCEGEKHEASFLAHQLFDAIKSAVPVGYESEIL
jgi:hypothetical protein